jgi:hypothetical protein
MITVPELAAELGTDAETLMSFAGVTIEGLQNLAAASLGDGFADEIRHVWRNTNANGVYVGPTVDVTPAAHSAGELDISPDAEKRRADDRVKMMAALARETGRVGGHDHSGYFTLESIRAASGLSAEAFAEAVRAHWRAGHVRIDYTTDPSVIVAGSTYDFGGPCNLIMLTV